MYMNQMNPYMHNMQGTYPHGQLYQYLHHQQQPTLYHGYMYSQDHTQNKRYWSPIYPYIILTFTWP